MQRANHPETISPFLPKSCQIILKTVGLFHGINFWIVCVGSKFGIISYGSNQIVGSNETFIVLHGNVFVGSKINESNLTGGHDGHPLPVHMFTRSALLTFGIFQKI